MAEDFIFRGGVVGPLNKNDYCRTMDLLGVANAFDLESNAFGFVVDPADPLCVRFFIRNTGEHTAPWQPWGELPPIPLKPTPGQTTVVAPTETARLLCASLSGLDLSAAVLPLSVRLQGRFLTLTSFSLSLSLSLSLPSALSLHAASTPKARFAISRPGWLSASTRACRAT